MKDNLSLSTKLTAILLIFLLIGAVNSITILVVVKQQQANARAINLAGRQRMLTQKMSKESFMLLKSNGSDASKGVRNSLKKTQNLFDTTLNGLMNGDPAQGLKAVKDKEVLAKLQEVKGLWASFTKHVNTLLSEDPKSEAGKAALNAIDKQNIPLLKTMNQAVQLYEKSNSANTILAIQGILFLLTLSIAVGAWFFTRKMIITPIKEISNILDESAEHISQASGTVSGAADNIADRASNQAAALEESSASLEEITTISKQNADNTTEANNLMQETQTVVEKVNGLMGNMNNSMSEISVAGEEIGKIINTIDEIAFQTNLLALNAAVEAARAGEAGAGFAVVADEVRNLAMRAAEAAKNTSQMIEAVIQKIHSGSNVVNESTDAFSEVTNRSEKVATLTDEIMKSINEQSHGVTQINVGITEMDKVTHENAATAEETASAARDMNHEAQELMNVVRQLTELVEGQK